MEQTGDAGRAQKKGTNRPLRAARATRFSGVSYFTPMKGVMTPDNVVKMDRIAPIRLRISVAVWASRTRARETVRMCLIAILFLLR